MYVLAVVFLAAAVAGQHPGTFVFERAPPLRWHRCNATDSCEPVSGSVVLEANERAYNHETDGFMSCWIGNEWTSPACTTDGDLCAASCAIEGADYRNDHGITTTGAGGALSQRYRTISQFGTFYGSRVFLLGEQNKYQTFTLLDNEFAFDVDLSKVECGMNAALQFVGMEADGGLARFPGNKAGAKYGTGYCDSSCTRSQKWVAGKGNVEGWEPSPYDEENGIGALGACCPEFALWSSNANSYSMASKPCLHDGFETCLGDGCNHPRFPQCDNKGCDYNPFRVGATDFFGRGKTVDTNEPFTVVTRFTDEAVTQFFLQDGVKIDAPVPVLDGFGGAAVGGLSGEYCETKARVFQEPDTFLELGGFQRQSQILRQPLVLALSINDDHYAWNLWLDSVFPLEMEGQPGAARGECELQGNNPAAIKARPPQDAVVWSNIRFGPIGTTVNV